MEVIVSEVDNIAIRSRHKLLLLVLHVPEKKDENTSPRGGLGRSK